MIRNHIVQFSLLATMALSLNIGCAGADDATPNDDATTEDALSQRFTRLKKGPTNADLKAFDKAGGKLSPYGAAVYRFNKVGAERTDATARMKRVKEVMHRYMCSFFDESIDLTHRKGAPQLQSTLKDLELDYYTEDQDASEAALKSTLTKILANPDLDVMSGPTSGNNTSGAVLGVYDIKNNEVYFYGFTNCGSDD